MILMDNHTFNSLNFTLILSKFCQNTPSNACDKFMAIAVNEDTDTACNECMNRHLSPFNLKYEYEHGFSVSGKKKTSCYFI